MEHKIGDGRTVFRESINPILPTPQKCHFFYYFTLPDISTRGKLKT